MVEGISKSLEQQPPQILQNNQKNKLIGSKNIKEENEQEIEEEEENEEEGGEVDEDKVKNRRRPLLHSGELEVINIYLSYLFRYEIRKYFFTNLMGKRGRTK